ncbi:MAG TPA: hypothetical protein VIN38_05820 [Thiobacillus sp.]
MSRQPPLPIRMGSRQKRSLYAIMLALWASGALWLLFHYFLRVPGDFGDMAHPLESWWLRLHGLMAFASLVAIGSVLPIHARRAWQLNKNRRSGLAMKAYLLWLALTGYALYYFLSESNEAWLPLAHWIAGLALPLGGLLHIRLGRRRAPTTPNMQRPSNAA